MERGVGGVRLAVALLLQQSYERRRDHAEVPNEAAVVPLQAEENA